MMNLRAKSYALRKEILRMVTRAKTGHIGGDYSVCDILTELYYRQMDLTPERFATPDHDRLILSKGHSVEALYCILADRGFFPKEELEGYSQYGSRLIGHPNNKVPGVEMNSGSLGHGLSVGVGMALAAKMNGSPSRVYVVMGDGELAEGSVWEGAMAVGHYKLDQLTAVVDRNRLQISGSTEQVMSQDDQTERWRAFGWNVIEAQGNDYRSLAQAFAAAKACNNKPSLILANTVKGFGVSFMEGKAAWHHRVPTPEEFHQAMEELSQKEQEALENESNC